MQKAVFCNAKGCFLLHKPMCFRQKTTKICMNKQTEVHEKRQETRILWICFSRTENNFDNIFTDKSIRNGRFITKGKTWDARQT